MQTSVFTNKDLSVGAVFTPLRWAEFAIERFGLFEEWLSGKTIFDPTMGEGNLLEGLISTGLKQGYQISMLPIENIYGIELNTGFFEIFFQKMKALYGLEMPRSNFENADILFLQNERSFDLVFGNPPWQNFTDLPDGYKKQLKPKFFEYSLVGNAQALLLGGSRIDFAALVIQKTIQKNLKQGGSAVFFMPLSLLLNDGANRLFRRFQVNGISFRVEVVFDFNDEPVFENVATRYGLVKFVRDEKQVFPVPFHRMEVGKWVEMEAQPAFQPTDPWSISSVNEADSMADFDLISLPKNATPRQGLNTCGANDWFFFDRFEVLDVEFCRVSNAVHSAVLPREFVRPLIMAKNFRENEPELPRKWVLLPYHPNGRPLEPREVLANEKLASYLLQHRNHLLERKGTMLGTWLQKGYWYALLGVGEYSFAPFKIVWEAYGKTVFEPRIFDGYWQANQSLQAFIPLKTRDEAELVLEKLKNRRIEKYLRSLKMEGTMNWAQPGKIRKLVRFEEPALTLF